MFKNLFLKETYHDLGFQRHINHINMKKVNVVSIMILLLELVMITTTYVYPAMYKDNTLEFYRGHYIALFIIALSYQVLARLYYKKIIKNNLKLGFIITGAIFFGLMWGVSITIKDLSFGGTMSVYLTFLFMSSIIIFIRPDFALFCYGMNQTYLLLNLPNSPRVIEMVINSVVFFLFAWFASREHYRNEYKNYRTGILLGDKNIQLEKQNLELHKLSMTDYLSGLYNRHSLDEILSKMWLENFVNKTQIGIMMLDINDFKQFNDAYGHIKGDEYIIQVSKVIKSFCEKHEGYGFRYGGDEFCMIFSHIEEAILDELDELFKREFLHLGKRNYNVSVSIGGFFIIPNNEEGAWTAVDQADKSLYEVKSSRRRRKDD